MSSSPCYRPGHCGSAVTSEDVAEWRCPATRPAGHTRSGQHTAPLSQVLHHPPAHGPGEEAETHASGPGLQKARGQGRRGLGQAEAPALTHWGCPRLSVPSVELA